MLYRRTVMVLGAVLAAIVCANLLTLRIPFQGEQEDDGYMFKLGWPCAFREETRHKLLWEKLDLSIDIVVAIVLLAGAGFCSEWVVRNQSREAPAAPRISYRTFLILLLEFGVLLGVNLHEFVVNDEPVRGWPITYTIEGDQLVHHRIQPAGLAVDFAVVALIFLGTYFAARRTWDARVGHQPKVSVD